MSNDVLSIGQIDNELDARTFGDFLYVQGIDNQVDPGKNGQWEIWVVSEKHIADATKILAEFRANPADSKYLGEAARAEAKRKEDLKRDGAAAPIELRGSWAMQFGRLGPVTLTLLAVSLIVAGLSKLGKDPAPVQSLFLTTDVYRGQLWRLVTPIFLHFGALHLIFNMLWLQDLGGMLERKKGSWFMLAIVLAIAVISNFAQFHLSGQNFGGMSGVVYGLLGYVWMQQKFSPFSGLALSQSTVTMMLLWLLLGYSGAIGVANSVHTVGLIVGVAWGFAAAKLRPH